MASRRRGQQQERTGRKPATTLEDRENEVISQAIDLAERQIQEGTASSQVITHFLKLGSTREQLEQERISHENELTQVKIQAIESQKRVEELYKDALNAMRAYSGQEPLYTEEDEGSDVL